MTNSKHQHTSTRKTPSFNRQMTNAESFMFEIWSLSGAWMLGLGISGGE
jgi:hypothetical protein